MLYIKNIIKNKSVKVLIMNTKIFVCNNYKKFVIIICIILVTSFYSISYAKSGSLETSKPTFQQTINYLASDYLKNMLIMTKKNNNDITKMEKNLFSVINKMLFLNQQDLKKTVLDLNTNVDYNLEIEMKHLYKEVLDMQQRLSFQFNQ